MRTALVIFVILLAGTVGAVDNITIGHSDTLDAGMTYTTDTTTRLTPFYVNLDIAVDTMVLAWKYVDNNDLQYGVIYDLDANGQPKDLLARTYDSLEDAGVGKVTFSSSVNLSAGTMYAIGTEVIDGGGGTHSPNKAKDTDRYNTYWQFIGERPDPWDTANDVTGTGTIGPFWQLIGSTLNPWDTTARDSGFKFQGCTGIIDSPLVGKVNISGRSYIKIGRRDAGIFDYYNRALLGPDDDTSTYFKAFWNDTADIFVRCTLKLKYYSETNAAGDSFYVYMLARKHIETEATWDIWRTDSNWTTAGVGSAGNDYYSPILWAFVPGDTNSLGYYVFTADSGSYDNACRAMDSLITGGYEFPLFFVRKKTEEANDDNIEIRNTPAYHPYFSYGVATVIERTGESQRHNPNWHDITRHQ